MSQMLFQWLWFWPTIKSDKLSFFEKCHYLWGLVSTNKCGLLFCHRRSSLLTERSLKERMHTEISEITQKSLWEKKFNMYLRPLFNWCPKCCFSGFDSDLQWKVINYLSLDNVIIYEGYSQQMNLNDGDRSEIPRRSLRNHSAKRNVQYVPLLDESSERMHTELSEITLGKEV